MPAPSWWLLFGVGGETLEAKWLTAPHDPSMSSVRPFGALGALKAVLAIAALYAMARLVGALRRRVATRLAHPLRWPICAVVGGWGMTY